MDVVAGATDAVGFALIIPTDGRQIGVHTRSDFGIEPRAALFGAKDNVQDDLTEGLRHRIE